METLSTLRQQKRSLLQQLSEIGDFRPGSLVGRFRKCGKPYCHCAQEGDAGHGPSWSLTRGVNGKTLTKIIPKNAVETTKKQIEEYSQFQKLSHELVEVNVHICDQMLVSQVDDDGQEAEKGGF